MNVGVFGWGNGVPVLVPTGSAPHVPGLAPFPLLATLRHTWVAALAVPPQRLAVLGTHITAGWVHMLLVV